jgi:hypothetical protein
MDKYPKSFLKGKYAALGAYNQRNLTEEMIGQMEYETVQKFLTEFENKINELNQEAVKPAGRNMEVLLTSGKTVTMYRPNAIEMAEIEELSADVREGKKMTSYKSTLTGYRMLLILTREEVSFEQFKEFEAVDANNMMFAQMKLMPNAPEDADV